MVYENMKSIALQSKNWIVEILTHEHKNVH